MLAPNPGPRPISLRTLMPGCKLLKANDIHVSSCTGDSRNVVPGDTFVALLGPHVDGHDYVHDAVQRGAKAVVGERLIPTDVPMCLVKDTRDAFSRICQALAGNPSDHLNLVGVTGTNGKTVTSVLIRSVLKAAGSPTGLMSTLGHADAYDTFPATQTTPPADVMAMWMGRMVESGCTHGVLEASSEGLSRRYMTGIQLDAAVLTNLRKDHLELHGTLGNYHRVKRRLFDMVRPEGVVILNADDPTSRTIRDKISRRVITVGMRSDADLMGEVLERHPSEQTFLLTSGNTTIPVQTRIVGDHHVKNCLAAAAVGLAYGIDLPTVVRGLEAVQKIPGRMEPIVCGQPFGVYADYARTPDMLSVALRSLRQVTAGRLICVYGCDGQTDGETRASLGRVVERGADLGVVTGDNPRDNSPLALAHDILDGYDNPARAHVMPDRVAAIEWALSIARSEDTVLLAGRGDQTLYVSGGEVRQFDDRQVARRWLTESNEPSTISDQGFGIVG